MVQSGRAHAERRLFARFALRGAARGVTGIALAVGAIVAASGGGVRDAPVAGLLGALALYACVTAVPRSRRPSVWSLIFDAAVIAGYVLLCDPPSHLVARGRQLGRIVPHVVGRRGRRGRSLYRHHRGHRPAHRRGGRPRRRRSRRSRFPSSSASSWRWRRICPPCSAARSLSARPCRVWRRRGLARRSPVRRQRGDHRRGDRRARPAAAARPAAPPHSGASPRSSPPQRLCSPRPARPRSSRHCRRSSPSWRWRSRRPPRRRACGARPISRPRPSPICCPASRPSRRASAVRGSPA